MELSQIYGTHIMICSFLYRTRQKILLEEERAAKEALQQWLSLKKVDLPLLGVISQITHLKRIHLIKHAIWHTLERRGQVVLLGSAPDPHIQNEFVHVASIAFSSS